ncbi:hypothetical protein J6590_033576 [Homalodisca vitripennis]|nr:hypothetical protein J6590_033576 [Homalodisca vitripennis]
MLLCAMVNVPLKGVDTKSVPERLTANPTFHEEFLPLDYRTCAQLTQPVCLPRLTGRATSFIPCVRFTACLLGDPALLWGPYCSLHAN